MAIQNLAAKPGNPVIDSSLLLYYFEVEEGQTIVDDYIVCYSDGTVDVDCAADLTTLWDSYSPPGAEEIPPTTLELLTDAVTAIVDIDDLKTFLIDDLFPVLFPS